MHEIINQDIVAAMNGQVVTTSMQVAEIFGKQHRNVTLAIKALDNTEEKDTLNFEEIIYYDSMNRPRTGYNITKRGFIKLIFGFTGKQAEKFKDTYLDAFEAMEEELRNRSVKKLSRLEYAQQLFHSAQLLHEAEQQREALLENAI